MTVYDRCVRVYKDGREETIITEVPQNALCLKCGKLIATNAVCNKTRDGRHVWIAHEGVDFEREDV